MSHPESQFDPRTMCRYPAAFPTAPRSATREAIMERANRLYLMGELAMAASLLLQLAS